MTSVKEMPGKAWRVEISRSQLEASPHDLLDEALNSCEYREDVIGFIAVDGGKVFLGKDEPPKELMDLAHFGRR